MSVGATVGNEARGGLPATGRSWSDVERDLVAREGEHLPPRPGYMDRYWPAHRPDVYEGAREAGSRFAYSNVFSLPGLPGLARLERELREMVGDVVELPDAGGVTLTGGGTESNFLAVKGARARGRERGVTKPNVVVPITGHPSFDKAGDELGVEIRRVAVGNDHRAQPGAMAAVVDEATVMLVGSAPCYPQGVVDPINELSDVAADMDTWFHIDACVGGFLVPFLIDLGEPLPDPRFSASGAWSIAADLHKFGYALNGISSLSVRDTSLQALHTFTLQQPGWPYRPYTRVGFAGSRPGATIASAWTTMQMLGRDGYLANADGIRRSARAIDAAVAAIEGLHMAAPPEAGIAVIGLRPGLDPGAISAGLLERGWDVATGLTPPSLHILLDPHPPELTTSFLDDLAEVTCRVAAGDTVARHETSYGD